MAGFFGLFGGRTKYVDEANAGDNPNSTDFYLSPDDAKTMGNIEYMRKPNTVKHTFPGNANNGGSFAVVKQFTATEEKTIDDRPGFSTPSTPTASTTSQPSVTPRRTASSTDTSMDMFRNMAKGMKR